MGNPLQVVSSQPLPDDHGAYAALSQATAISPQPPSTWEKFKTWVHDANYLPSTEYYKKYPTGPMDDVAAFVTKLVPFAKDFNQLDQELKKHELGQKLEHGAAEQSRQLAVGMAQPGWGAPMPMLGAVEREGLGEGVKALASQLGLEWRGWQEGVPGKHPDLAIFQDTKSGTSVGVPRDKLTPENLQQHVDAARQRMSGLPKGKPDFSSVPGHLIVAKPTLGPGQDFYSPLEHVIQTKVPDRVSGDQLLSTLQNAGVSKRELEWSGLDQLAQQGQLSKADILTQVRERTPHVETVEKTQEGAGQKELLKNHATATENLKASLRSELGVSDQTANRLLNSMSEDLPEDELVDKITRSGGKASDRKLVEAWMDRHAGEVQKFVDLNDEVNAYEEGMHPDQEGPKYGSYTLPGGTNYREVLLTLPNETTRNLSTNPYDLREARIEHPEQTYFGPHFDEPNVVAHLRLDDRTDVSGNKTLFVEELQSDWARELREKQQGYQSVGGMAVEPNDVPNMPFDKSWQELALKKAIDIAVKEGYDQIAWTTGEQQADRYNLRNYFTQVRLSDTDEGLELEATPKGGGRPFFRQTTEENLPEEVGRDNAKKLLDQLEEARKQKGKEPYATTALKFDQPQGMGGEHHLRLYDEMVPQFLNRYTKKWGGKVETTEIKVPEKLSKSSTSGPDVYARYSKEPIKFQTLKITPEMRRAVKQGQPLFGGAKLDFSGIPGHAQHAPPAEGGGADLGAVYGGKPGKGKYAKFLQGEKKDFSSIPGHQPEEYNGPVNRKGFQKSLEKTHQELVNNGWKYKNSFPDDFHRYEKTSPNGEKHQILISDSGELSHQRPDIVKNGSQKLLEHIYGGHKDAREYINSETLSKGGEKKIEQFEPGDIGYMRPDGSIVNGVADEDYTHHDLALEHKEDMNKILGEGGVRYRIDTRRNADVHSVVEPNKSRPSGNPVGIVQIDGLGDQAVGNAKKVIERLPTDNIIFESYPKEGGQPVSFEGTPKEVIAQINRHVRANWGERYEVGEEGGGTDLGAVYGGKLGRGKYTKLTEKPIFESGGLLQELANKNPNRVIQMTESDEEGHTQLGVLLPRETKFYHVSPSRLKSLKPHGIETLDTVEDLHLFSDLGMAEDYGQQMADQVEGKIRVYQVTLPKDTPVWDGRSGMKDHVVVHKRVPGEQMKELKVIKPFNRYE